MDSEHNYEEGKEGKNGDQTEKSNVDDDSVSAPGEEIENSAAEKTIQIDEGIKSEKTVQKVVEKEEKGKKSTQGNESQNLNEQQQQQQQAPVDATPETNETETETEKPAEDEIPSFSEWAQKALEEEQKKKEEEKRKKEEEKRKKEEEKRKKQQLADNNNNNHNNKSAAETELGEKHTNSSSDSASNGTLIEELTPKSPDSQSAESSTQDKGESDSDGIPSDEESDRSEDPPQQKPAPVSAPVPVVATPNHPPSGVIIAKPSDNKLKKNFASIDCGAKVVSANAESQGAGNIISSSR